MIDYEKLKEIVGQLSLDAVNGKTEIPQHSSTRAYLVALIDVVDKCKELTEPESRYKVGETWWYLDSGSQHLIPCWVLITEQNKDFYRADDEFYPSKAELIQAQIKYWYSQFTMEERLKLWGCVHPDEIPETGLKNDEISTRSDDMSMPYANEDTDYHSRIPNAIMNLMDEN